MLKSNFKIFLIFILIFNLFTTTSLAATNKEAYNQEELMQYPGYGKAMYETIVDETTFITGQYTDNKEFVNKSIDQIRDYGKFWWNEQNWESEAWTYDRFKEMVAKPTGYLLTVGDWVKKLFTGYDEQYYPPVVVPEKFYDFTPYVKSIKKVDVVVDEPNMMARMYVHMDIIKDFELRFKRTETAYQSFFFTPTHNILEIQGLASIADESKDKAYIPILKLSDLGIFTGNNEKVRLEYYYKTPFPWRGTSSYVTSKDARTVALDHFTNFVVSEFESGDVNRGLNLFINYVNTANNDMTAQIPLAPSVPSVSPIANFVKHIKENPKNVVTPQPRPYLSCPNGTKIEMSISGSTFLGIDGKAMIVNKDGTAQVDSAICNLGWDKPEVKYLEGRPAIQTPDKGWQDVETGELIIPGENGGMQCVENGVVVPCNDIEKPDGSLLAYVKNAYEYATSLIDTAVNGLKQLSSGAVGMIELYKIYMSWLPTEIQTVMYSGLAIMIGLRVFRK